MYLCPLPSKAKGGASKAEGNPKRLWAPVKANPHECNGSPSCGKTIVNASFVCDTIKAPAMTRRANICTCVVSLKPMVSHVVVLTRLQCILALCPETARPVGGQVRQVTNDPSVPQGALCLSQPACQFSCLTCRARTWTFMVLPCLLPQYHLLCRLFHPPPLSNRCLLALASSHKGSFAWIFVWVPLAPSPNL